MRFNHDVLLVLVSLQVQLRDRRYRGSNVSKRLQFTYRNQ